MENAVAKNTVENAVEKENVVWNSLPPTKKQRTIAGLGHPTATGGDVNHTLKKKNTNKKKKKVKVVIPIHESIQYKAENYKGALLEHFQKQGDESKLSFDTQPKPGNDPKNQPGFICFCKAGVVSATGEAKSKKQALQLAAFAAIQKMKLISPIEQIPLKADAKEKVAPKLPLSPKRKETKPIIENKQYLNGNFRGALQEYLARNNPGVALEFKTELKEPNSSPGVFIAMCRVIGGDNEQLKSMVGTGHAASKKSAVHFSALEFILKLNLLTPQQHFKIHYGKNLTAVDNGSTAQVQGATAMI